MTLLQYIVVTSIILEIGGQTSPGVSESSSSPNCPVCSPPNVLCDTNLSCPELHSVDRQCGACRSNVTNCVDQRYEGICQITREDIEFVKCANTPNCMFTAFVLDGEDDCGDSSDENACLWANPCDPNAVCTFEACSFNVTCTCNEGYQGDGTFCALLNTTLDPSPDPGSSLQPSSSTLPSLAPNSLTSTETLPSSTALQNSSTDATTVALSSGTSTPFETISATMSESTIPNPSSRSTTFSINAPATSRSLASTTAGEISTASTAATDPSLSSSSTSSLPPESTVTADFATVSTLQVTSLSTQATSFTPTAGSMKSSTIGLNTTKSSISSTNPDLTTDTASTTNPNGINQTDPTMAGTAESSQLFENSTPSSTLKPSEPSSTSEVPSTADSVLSSTMLITFSILTASTVSGEEITTGTDSSFAPLSETSTSETPAPVTQIKTEITDYSRATTVNSTLFNPTTASLSASTTPRSAETSISKTSPTKGSSTLPTTKSQPHTTPARGNTSLITLTAHKDAPVPPKSCAEILWENPRALSGVYKVYPRNSGELDVFCHYDSIISRPLRLQIGNSSDLEGSPDRVETDLGVGWTEVMSRKMSNFNLSRSWKQFSEGFGSALNGSYWAGKAPHFAADLHEKYRWKIQSLKFLTGLSYLNELTASDDFELMVRLRRGRDTFSAIYDSVVISDETSGFQLFLGDLKFGEVDVFGKSNGSNFSAEDRGSNTSCAQQLLAPWWFPEDCSTSGILTGDQIEISGTLFDEVDLSIRQRFFQAPGVACKELVEFQCRSDGVCIAAQKLFDGVVDCLDGSDENCTGLNCSIGQCAFNFTTRAFECGCEGGVRIPRNSGAYCLPSNFSDYPLDCAQVDGSLIAGAGSRWKNIFFPNCLQHPLCWPVAQVECRNSSFSLSGSSADRWTVLGSRSGQVGFNRSYHEYANGFGDPLNNNYWIGLNYMNKMTSTGRIYELLLEVTDINNRSSEYQYRWFAVGSETQGYQLKIGELIAATNTIGDGLASANGNIFSASNKGFFQCCAKHFGGAWWFGPKCSNSGIDPVTFATKYPASPTKKPNIRGFRNTGPRCQESITKFYLLLFNAILSAFAHGNQKI